MNETPSSCPNPKVIRQIQLEETTVKLCAVAPAPGLQGAVKSRTTLKLNLKLDRVLNLHRKLMQQICLIRKTS